MLQGSVGQEFRHSTVQWEWLVFAPRCLGAQLEGLVAEGRSVGGGMTQWPEVTCTHISGS